MYERYLVIGCPIGHTMSPFIHRRLFKLSGRAASYEAAEIAPELLPARMPELRALDGFNITVPHKQAVIPFLDALDESARLYGAVNTVQCGKRAVGYNTDGYGFLHALRLAGAELQGRVLLCGAGGAARMAAFEAVRAGCRLTVAVRESSLGAAHALADELTAKFSGADVSCCLLGGLDARGEPYDLLVNATPCGMYPKPDASPVTPETVSRCAAVFDAVYNPCETLLLRTARSLGKRCAEGLPMLVWQAARAHEIWYGASFSERDLAALTGDAGAELARVFGAQPHRAD